MQFFFVTELPNVWPCLSLRPKYGGKFGKIFFICCKIPKFKSENKNKYHRFSLNTSNDDHNTAPLLHPRKSDPLVVGH